MNELDELEFDENDLDVHAPNPFGYLDKGEEEGDEDEEGGEDEEGDEGDEGDEESEESERPIVVGKSYGKNYNKEHRQDNLVLYKNLLNAQYETVKQLNSKAKTNKKLLDTDSSGKSYNYVNKMPNHPDYRANLVCFKCQAPHCKNIVCLGLPLCTQHWAELGIVKKQAFRDIEGVHTSIGDGVFVAPNKCFPARYKIMQYVGELLTQNELDGVFPDDNIAPYTMQMPKQKMFISSERVRGMASYINHSETPNVKITAIKITNKFFTQKNETKLKANTIKVKNKYALYVVSLKYLCAGEELLLDYGADYNVMATPETSITSEGKIPADEEHHARSSRTSKKPIINTVHGLEFPISHSNSTRFSFDRCPKNAGECTTKKNSSMKLNKYQDYRRRGKEPPTKA